MAAMIQYTNGETLTIKPGAQLSDLGARVVSISNGGIRFELLEEKDGVTSRRTVLLKR
jgi:hypothetical protein